MGHCVVGFPELDELLLEAVALLEVEPVELLEPVVAWVEPVELEAVAVLATVELEAEELALAVVEAVVEAAPEVVEASPEVLEALELDWVTLVVPEVVVVVAAAVVEVAPELPVVELDAWPPLEPQPVAHTIIATTIDRAAALLRDSVSTASDAARMATSQKRR